MDLSIALKTAKDPESSPEQLDALFEHGEKVDRLLARHPKALADLLEKLSHSSDRSTRRYVVGNPNASKEVLVKLASQFPGDFFKNPVFDWMLLEDPGMLTHLGQGVLKNILKRPDCPLSFLTWTAENGSDQEKLAVAMNPAASLQVLERLVALGGAVGDAAKAHGKIQEGGPTEEPVAALAREVKSALAAMDLDDARLCWRRGFIGPGQWASLSPFCRLGVLGLTTDSCLDLWMQQGAMDTELRKNVQDTRIFAASTLIPEEMLIELSKLPDKGVLVRIASNPNTPTFVLEKLAVAVLKDGFDLEFCIAILENENYPLSYRAQAASILSKDKWSERYVIKYLTDINRHAGTSIDFLEHFSSHRAERVRWAVAVHPLVSVSILDKLADDPDWLVRCSVAESPIISSNSLMKLHKDCDVHVRSCIENNISTPVFLLEELAKDKDLLKFRKAVKESFQESRDINSLAPNRQDLGLVKGISSIENLSGSKVNSQGAATPAPLISAKDPTTPLPLLVLLAKSKNTEIQLAVAANPSAPMEIRTKVQAILAEKAGLTGFPGFPKSYPVHPDIRHRAEALARARRWWHEQGRLAKRFKTEPVMKRMPPADELVIMFRKEAELLLRDPEASWTARLIGSNEQELLTMSLSAVDKACNRPLHVEGESGRKLHPARLLGLSSPTAPTAALIKRYRSVEWIERLAVAYSRNVPPNVLTSLMKDANKFVARQAGISFQRSPKPPAVVAPLPVCDVPEYDTSAMKVLDGDTIRVGQVVFHSKFGEGVVISAEGWGIDVRAQVNFVLHGSKWLALAIAKLRLVK